jgi:hypothetical protein
VRALDREQARTRRSEMLEELARRVMYVLDHRLCVTMVTIMTAWALFVEDLQFAVPLHKKVDRPFAIVTLIFFILFMIEQTLRSWAARKEYFLSFFWWMELAANISMVFAMGPLFAPTNTCFGDFVDLNALLSGSWQAGTRLARVMRLLRVIRVVRVFASCNKQRNPQSAAVKNQQSAVGKRINEMLVKSMILIVIALQIIFPFLSFEEIDSSRYLAFSMLALGMNGSQANVDMMMAEYKYHGETNAATSGNEVVYERGYFKLMKLVLETASGVRTEALYDSAGEPTYGYTPCLGSVNRTFDECPGYISQLRCSAIMVVPANADPTDGMVAFWDKSQIAQRESMYNIILTILLMVVILVMYVISLQSSLQPYVPLPCNHMSHTLQP